MYFIAVKSGKKMGKTIPTSELIKCAKNKHPLNNYSFTGLKV